ncbi:hypothetical protein [Candidatus Uabimicrobium sp. HlEnr_7]|uniref:hypothetical protein n=1 Tax=Candidatus Uabimicrobium helgolandensis TaxID=3095367 RepID=UPI00355744AD
MTSENVTDNGDGTFTIDPAAINTAVDGDGNTVLTIELGDVVNEGSDEFNPEQLGDADTRGDDQPDITINFDGIVLDDAVNNNNGDNKAFDTTITTADDDGNEVASDDDNDEVAITEPVLNVTLEQSVTNDGVTTAVNNGDVFDFDAGDTVSYTATVEHDAASTADAFDLNIVLDIPANTELQSLDLGDGNIINDPAILANFLVDTDNDGIDDQIQITDVQLEAVGLENLAQNDTLEIKYDVEILDTAVIGDNFAVDAAVDFDSQEDVGPNVDADGNEIDRAGVQAQDDIALQSVAQIAVETNIGVDNNNDGVVDLTNFQIGDDVPVQIDADVLEGTSENVVITQVIPVGIEFDLDTFVITLDAGVTSENVTDNGDGTFTIDPAAINTAVDGDGNTVLTIELGDVVNEGSNEFNPEQLGDADTRGDDQPDITINFDGIVLDDAVNNNNGDNKAFDTTITTADDDGNEVASDDDNDEVAITEPVLNVTLEQSVTNDGVTTAVNNGDVFDFDAGDTVSYTATVEHDAASTADAFDLNIVLDIPANTELQSLDLGDGNVINDPAVLANFLVDTDDDGVDDQIQITDVQLEAIGLENLVQNDTLEIKYDVEILDTAVIGDNFAIDAAVDFDTQEDVGPNVDADGNEIVRTGVQAQDNIALQSVSQIAVETNIGVDNNNDGVVDLTNFQIGDDVPVQIDADVLEGTSENVVITQVIPAGIEFDLDTFVITLDAGVTSDNVTDNGDGTFTIDPAAINTAVDGDGNTVLTIELGDVVNEGSNEFNPEQLGDADTRGDDQPDITINFDGIVLDDVVNNNNADNKNFTTTITTSDDNGNELASNVDNDEIEIVEPILQVEIVQEFNGVAINSGDQLADLDAGDVINYTATITHVGDATADDPADSQTDAFDIQFNANVPDGTEVTEVRVTLEDGTELILDADNGDFVVQDVNGVDTIIITDAVLGDLALGNEIIVEYDVTLLDEINPLDVLETDAVVDFDSQDAAGDNNIERNNNADADAITTQLPDTLDIDIEIANDDFRIGDTVEGTINLNLQEGTTDNVVITLPVPDGLTIDPVNGIEIIFPNGASSTIQDAQIINDELVIDFGNVTVPGVDGFDNNGVDIQINFDAIVQDDNVNNNNTDDKLFEVTATSNNNGTPNEATDNDEIEIVEPILQVDIVQEFNGVAVNSGDQLADLDAGDVINYTATITHVGDATADDPADSQTDAFDIQFNANVPDGTEVTEVRVTLEDGTELTLDPDNGDFVVQDVNGVDTIIITDAVLGDLALGNEIIVEYDVTLLNEINPLDVLETDAVVDFDSQDAAGDNNIERDNNADADAITTQLPDTLDIDIEIANDDFRIGDTVEGTINLNLQEGTTDNVVITLPVPDGLTIDPVNGIEIIFPNGASSTIQDAQIINDELVIDFGNVTVPGVDGFDNNGVDIQINFDAIVQDDNVNNNNTDDKLFEVTATSNNNGTPNEATDNDEIEIVEPILQVDIVQEFNGVAVNSGDQLADLDAGDVINYTATITHVGDATADDPADSQTDAFDIQFNANVPDGTEVTEVRVTLEDGTQLTLDPDNGDFVVQDVNGVDTIIITDAVLGDLALGNEIIVEYDVTLLDEINPLDVLETDAVVDFDSQDAAGDNNIERDNNADADAITTQLPDTLDVDIDIANDDFRIGDTVEGTINVNLQEGTTDNVVITLPVPDGLTIDPVNGIEIIFPNGASSTIQDAQIINDELVIDFGNVTVPGVDGFDNDGVDIQINFDAIVQDDNVNNNNTDDKLFEVTATSNNNGTPNEATDNDEIEIVEPILQVDIVQEFNGVAVNSGNQLADLDAGDVINYTATITHVGDATADDPADSQTDAFDIQFNANVPDGTEVTEVRVTLEDGTELTLDPDNGDFVVQDVNGVDTIIITDAVLGDLALGNEIIVEYDVTLLDEINPLDVLETDAVVDFDSQDAAGDNNIERDNNADADAITTQLPDTLDVDIEIANDDFRIGDTVEGTINLNLQEGTTDNVVITLPVPDGLTIDPVNGIEIIFPNGASSTIQDAQIINDELVIDFGNVTVPGVDGFDNNGVDIQINFDAIVQDDNVNNNNTDDKLFEVTATSNNNGTPNEATDNDEIEIVEPILQVDIVQEFNGVAVNSGDQLADLDAGDVINYTATITHVGDATADDPADSQTDAFDIQFNANVPDGTEVTEVRVTLEDGTELTLDPDNGDFVVQDVNGVDTIIITDAVLGDLALGNEIIVEYDVTLLNEINPLDVLETDAVVDFDSQDAAGDNNIERDNNADADAITTQLPDTLDIDIEIANDDFRIGDTVEGTINLNLQEGTTDNVVITLPVPDGLTIDPVNGIEIIFPNGASSTIQDAQIINDELVIDFGNVTVPGVDGFDNNGVDIQINFDAIVQDDNVNNNNTDDKLFEVTATSNNNGVLNEASDDDQVEIVEPILQVDIVQEFNGVAVNSGDQLADLDAGDVINYTATITHVGDATADDPADSQTDAFDIQFNANVPDGTEVTEVRVTLEDGTELILDANNGDFVVQDVNGVDTIIITDAVLGDLALGNEIIVEYDVTLLDEINPLDVLETDAVVDFDSQDAAGDNNIERDNNADADAITTQLPDTLDVDIEIANDDFRIGDTVEGTINVNLQEGTTDNVVITLPVPDGLTIDPVNGIEIIFPNGASSTIQDAQIINDELVIDFGNVEVPGVDGFDNNGVDIQINFDAIVQDDNVNNNNTDDKLFEVTATSNNNGVENEATDDDQVEIVEPILQVDIVQEFNGVAVNSGDQLADLDAGDVINYTATITHVGDATADDPADSQTDAFDIQFNANVPDGTEVTEVRVTLEDGTQLTLDPDNGDFVVQDVNGVDTIIITDAVLGDLALGNEIIVEYDVTLLDEINPLDVLETDAVVDFDSQDAAGDNNIERDNNADADAITTQLPDTLEVDIDIANDDFRIGDTVEGTINVNLQEGTTDNVVITLPVPDGLTIDPVNGIEIIFPNGASSTIQDVQIINDELVIDFGNVTVPGVDGFDNDGVDIQINFDAIVQDDNVNNNNTDDKLFEVTATSNNNGVENEATDDDQAEIVEPILQVDIVQEFNGVAVNSGDQLADLDAGDVINYTATITHVGDATADDPADSQTDAFDIQFNANVPDGTEVTEVRVTLEDGTQLTLDPDNGDFVVQDVNGVDTIIITDAVLGDLALGNEIIVEYDVTLLDEINPLDVLETDAVVDFDSQDAAGDNNIERDNNADADAITTQLPDTLEVDIDIANDDFRIGDTVEGTINVNLQEGTTDNVVITLPVPDGLTIDPVNGIEIIFPNGASSTIQDVQIINDELVIDFGNVTVPGVDGFDNDGVDIQINFDAIVQDDNVNNNNTDDKLFEVTATSNNNGVLNEATDDDQVEIVEPILQVDIVQEFNGVAVNSGDQLADLDAGDVINYTATITHVGDATADDPADSQTDAFDIQFNANVPDGTEVTEVRVTLEDGTQLTLDPDNGDFVVQDVNGVDTIIITDAVLGDLALGNEIIVEYDVTLLDEINPLDVLETDAVVDFDSQDAAGDNNIERDNNADADAITTQLPNTLEVDIDIANDDFQIGDTVEGTINVNLQEGTTENVVVTLPVPDGLTIDPVNGIEIIFPNGASSTIQDAQIINGELVIDFGNVEVPGVDGFDNDGVDIQINFDAIVQNDDNNNNGDTKDFEVSISSNNNDTPIVANDDDNVTITEPSLEVTITPDNPTPRNGDTLEFTIDIEHLADSTADAHDVIVTVPLEEGFTFNGNTTLPDGVTVEQIGDDLVFTIPILPEGEDVSLVFEVDIEGIGIGTVVPTNADVIFDSQPDNGDNDIQRTGNPNDDGGDINDLNIDNEAQVLITGSDLNISIDDNVDDVTPGDDVAISVVVANNGNEESTGAVITQTLPETVDINQLEVLDDDGNDITDNVVVVENADGTFTLTFPPFDLPDGEEVTFTINTVILDVVPAGIDDFNIDVSIVDDGTHGVDPTPENNINDDTDVLIAAPDLFVSKSTDETEFFAGDTIPYTIVVQNNGNQDATGVFISDTLQNELNFQSAIATLADGSNQLLTAEVITVVSFGELPEQVNPEDVITEFNGEFIVALEDVPQEVVDDGRANNTFETTGVFDSDTNTFNFTIGDFAVGEEVTIELNTVLDEAIAAFVEDITNTVTVSDDGENGEDLNSDDNTAQEIDVLVSIPDLQIEKTNNVNSLQPGQVTTYELTIRNLGTQEALGLEIVDTLPEGVFDFIEASDNGQFDPETGEVTFNIDSLQGLSETTVTVTLRVNDDLLSSGIRTITNIASVTDDGSQGIDLTPDNNITQDVDDFLFFVFDALDSNPVFDPANPSGNDDGFGDPTRLRRQPFLSIDPIYSGTAAPNSSQQVVIYGSGGNIIGTQTVMADTGGNWLATFPNTVIFEEPHHIEIVSQQSHVIEDSGYNMRTYFSSVLHSSVYAKELSSIDDLVTQLTAEQIETLLEWQQQALLQLQGNSGFLYEFLPQGAIPSTK